MLRVRLYRVFRTIGRVLFPLVLDVRVLGARNVPRTGPVLLVSNHESYTDPVVLGTVCPRPIVFLAKSELFEQSRLLERLIRTLGCVSIRRDGYAVSAVRRAEEVLERGEVLGLFPEGGITTPGDLKPGAALIAARTGVPVVPVHLSGTCGMYDPEAYLLRARPIRVEFGRPFHPHAVGDRSKPKEHRERVLDVIRSHITRDMRT